MAPKEISHLLELHELALAQASRYPRKRFLFERLRKSEGRRFTGVVGPRGSGKTVLLRQLARELDDSVYISADTLAGGDLFDIAARLHGTMGVKFILLDEVHFLPGFDSVLKKIYDFLDVRVIFTSSVSIAMYDSPHDLSRRVELLLLPPFGLREYIYFTSGLELPSLAIEDIAARRWSSEHLRRASPVFDRYLKGGLLPFSLEEPDVLPLVGNILKKILADDLPRVARLPLDEIDLIEKMIEFIGLSEVEDISYSSLSRNLGITKYKAQKYTDLLQKAFVLQVVKPAGTGVTREPKILMYLPYRLLYREFGRALGAMREDFCVEALAAAGISARYLKSSRGRKTPDFLVETPSGKLALEVGGRGKSMRQFKGITLDRKLVLVHADESEGPRRPLYLLGYLS